MATEKAESAERAVQYPFLSRSTAAPREQITGFYELSLPSAVESFLKAEQIYPA
jgi:hypothetical protein